MLPGKQAGRPTGPPAVVPDWRVPVLTVVCAAALVLPLGASEPWSWSFDDMRPGQAPAGFTLISTGEAKNGRWEILREGADAVLAQLAPVAMKGSYRLALAPEVSARDVTITVRIRTVGGSKSAGLVWRYSAQDDYYLARLNLGDQAGEKEVNLYRVIHGNRSTLSKTSDLELDAASWHTLKIDHRGDRIRAWLNGIPVGESRDRSIEGTGHLGVWVNADSTIWFDDLQAEEHGT